jgi:hypothetical protein
MNIKSFFTRKPKVVEAFNNCKWRMGGVFTFIFQKAKQKRVVGLQFSGGHFGLEVTARRLSSTNENEYVLAMKTQDHVIEVAAFEHEKDAHEALAQMYDQIVHPTQKKVRKFAFKGVVVVFALVALYTLFAPLIEAVKLTRLEAKQQEAALALAEQENAQRLEAAKAQLAQQLAQQAPQPPAPEQQAAPAIQHEPVPQISTDAIETLKNAK